MESNMTFLCEMWKFSAEEYMQFLERNGIKCLAVQIIFKNRTAVFADEDKYLELSFGNSKFNEAEKQIIKLLERSEKLVDKFMELAARAENNSLNTEEDLTEYDREE